MSEQALPGAVEGVEVESRFLRPEWVDHLTRAWYDEWAWPRVWAVTVLGVDEGLEPHLYYDAAFDVWQVFELLATPGFGFVISDA